MGSEPGRTEKVLAAQVREHTGTWMKVLLTDTRAAGEEPRQLGGWGANTGWRVIGVRTRDSLGGKRDFTDRNW